jgi:hypothetical protein
MNRACSGAGEGHIQTAFKEGLFFGFKELKNFDVGKKVEVYFSASQHFLIDNLKRLHLPRIPNSGND